MMNTWMARTCIRQWVCPANPSRPTSASVCRLGGPITSYTPHQPELLLGGLSSSPQRRWMGGGSRFTVHSRNLFPDHKHKLILRYCDQFFGVTEKENPRILRTIRRGVWVRIETLMYHDLFKGWTKVKHFINAFAKSKGRYIVDTKRNVEEAKRQREVARCVAMGKPVPPHLEKPKPMLKQKPKLKYRNQKVLTDDEIFYVRLSPGFRKEIISQQQGMGQQNNSGKGRPLRRGQTNIDAPTAETTKIKDKTAIHDQSMSSNNQEKSPRQGATMPKKVYTAEEPKRSVNAVNQVVENPKKIRSKTNGRGKTNKKNNVTEDPRRRFRSQTNM